MDNFFAKLWCDFYGSGSDRIGQSDDTVGWFGMVWVGFDLVLVGFGWFWLVWAGFSWFWFVLVGLGWFCPFFRIFEF